LLGTIALLGKSLDDNRIKTAVDEPNASNVFVINLDENCKYIGLDVRDYKEEEGEKYLYKFAKEGHKRGKFITGLITYADIHTLKNDLRSLTQNPASHTEARQNICKFKKKNILWINKHGIFRNNYRKALAKISDNSADKNTRNPLNKKCIIHKILLECIKNEIINQQDIILDDICEKVLHSNYEDILLTVTIGGKYLGDIEGFPEILLLLAQGEESSISATAKCIVCNEYAVTGKLKESLPFFTVDKLNFIPDGNDKNLAKVFPLCRSCYNYLRSGYKYIKKELNFSIPNSYNKVKLRFWLIPQLNEPFLIKEYLKAPEHGLASFKELIRMSRDMDTVREIDLSSGIGEITRNVLTYVAIFYHYDRTMRLIEAVDGIYPSRLEELSKYKGILDKIALKNGILDKIALKNGVAHGFDFRFLVDILEKEKGKKKQGKDNQHWMKTMSYIMSSIFTCKSIDETFIVKILLMSIRSALSQQDLEEMYQIVIRSTLIVEYLHRIGTLNPEPSVHSESNPWPLDDKAKYALNFLNSHSGILYNDNLRAVCAIGIEVGVIIKAQMRYFESDNASFSSKLNRLEMDYNRLLDLPRQAWPKLKHYEAEEFEELFTFLTNNEISRLDLNQLKVVKKEILNLIFVIGMAHGFTLFSHFAVANSSAEAS
jgi:CRISPR-associated protein Cas8b/Csh1 subtype I-B